MNYSQEILLDQNVPLKSADLGIKASYPETHFYGPCMKSVLSIAVKMHRRCGNGVSAHKCSIKCYNSDDKTRLYAITILRISAENVSRCFDLHENSCTETSIFKIPKKVYVGNSFNTYHQSSVNA